jgi:predicted RNA-binding Zn ribbon-like protein
LLTERETIQAKLRERNSVPVVATEPLPQFERIAVEHPSAARLIEIALRGDVDSDRPLEPIYLRAPYITTAGK